MFTDTMRRWLGSVTDSKNQFNLTRLFYPLYDRHTSRSLNTAGLVIHGSAGTVPKTGATAFYALATGVLVTIAASTDMPALVGTVVNATFNVFCFFVDSAGTVTSAMGTAGATLAAVVFPQFPEGKALVGFIVVNPTGTGNFVGGTTALDDATVVPTVAYVSAIGGFDPRALTGLSKTP
jgi:hypothetical protein